MKTKFRLILLLVIAASIAEAQDVAFGLKGGLNLTNLNVNDAEATYNSRTGYHAGVFLRSKFNKVAVQPELLLFTQSNKINYSGSSINPGTVTNNFTYLSIPVMLKFYLLQGINIHAGPQFGFLLDGEQDQKTALFTGTRDIKDYYKSSDVSISTGAGWDFKFGLSFDVRYNIGIKDINDAVGGEEAKSKAFLISLGWNFLK